MILTKMKEDWWKLRSKVQVVMKKLDENRQINKISMGIPKEYVDELLKIFYEELERQRIENQSNDVKNEYEF